MVELTEDQVNLLRSMFPIDGWFDMRGPTPRFAAALCGLAAAGYIEQRKDGFVRVTDAGRQSKLQSEADEEAARIMSLSDEEVVAECGGPEATAAIAEEGRKIIDRRSDQ